LPVITNTKEKKEVVKDMDLNSGDILDWEVYAAGEKGKKHVKVRKLE
jgi:hypothetical protein